MHSKTEIGQFTSGEYVDFSGDFAPRTEQKTKDRFDFSLGYALVQSHTEASSTQGSISDQTTEVSGGAGWRGGNGFQAGLAYSYSSTPNENLTASNPSVYFGYTYKMKSSRSDDFTRKLGAKLSLGTTNYLEAFSGALPRRRGGTRPVSGEAELRQNSLSLEFPLQLISFMDITPIYTHYTYNKDVQQFLANLDVPSSVQIGRSNFGNTVAGLPEWTFELEFVFYFLEDWEALLDFSRGRQASDNSENRSTELGLFYNLDDWKLGIEYLKTEYLSFEDNIGILNVHYYF